MAAAAASLVPDGASREEAMDMDHDGGGLLRAPGGLSVVLLPLLALVRLLDHQAQSRGGNSAS